jgi:Permease for cytosine/purines, uracil, thiamine, allantoin
MASGAAPEGAEALDYTNRPVPREGRMGPLALTMAFWSCCSAMFWIVVAATLANVYGTTNALIGLILTIITYAAVNAVITRYAVRTGLSVSLFSRLLFGRTGSALATLIFAATAIYYAVFEGSVIALAGTFLYPALDYKIAALLVVLYSVPLVFGSVQHWLDKFNGVLLPIYLAGLAIAVGLAIYHYGYSNAWLSVEGTVPSPTGWWNVYVAYMGVWIMMMFTFDYARFGRKEDESYHALFNFGAPFYVVALLLSGLAGIFLVHTIPVEGALSEVSAVKAIIIMMGIFGLIFVWVTQTRINTANYYLASVNLESLVRLTLKVDLPKVIWAIVVGIIVYVLMLANVVHYILAALAYQGIFVVAWVGVALAYMLRQAPNDPEDAGARPDSAYPAYNASGLAAWFGSVILGIILMNVSSLASFSAPVTAVSSFLIFWVMGTRAKLVTA